MLLGQHALLPETARALAELQAAGPPVALPELDLGLGLTLDGERLPDGRHAAPAGSRALVQLRWRPARLSLWWPQRA